MFLLLGGHCPLVYMVHTGKVWLHGQIWLAKCSVYVRLTREETLHISASEYVRSTALPATRKHPYVRGSYAAVCIYEWRECTYRAKRCAQRLCMVFAVG